MALCSCWIIRTQLRGTPTSLRGCTGPYVLFSHTCAAPPRTFHRDSITSTKISATHLAVVKGKSTVLVWDRERWELQRQFDVGSLARNFRSPLMRCCWATYEGAVVVLGVCLSRPAQQCVSSIASALWRLQRREVCTQVRPDVRLLWAIRIALALSMASGRFNSVVAAL